MKSSKLGAIGLSAAGLFALSTLAFSTHAHAEEFQVKNGRIKQSVVPWCFNPMPVAELAKHSAALGLKSVELCDPKEWPMLMGDSSSPMISLRRSSQKPHDPAVHGASIS